MKIAIYVRVSRLDLKPENQLMELEKYAMALKRVEDHRKLPVHNNIAAAYHRLADDLVKAGKAADINKLWKSGIQRFPGCVPCRSGAEWAAQRAKASAQGVVD